ncbi:MAG TPA: hypothetical protein VGC42_05050 [Kofleriaceae bacterium]
MLGAERGFASGNLLGGKLRGLLGGERGGDVGLRARGRAALATIIGAGVAARIAAIIGAGITAIIAARIAAGVAAIFVAGLAAIVTLVRGALVTRAPVALVATFVATSVRHRQLARRRRDDRRRRGPRATGRARRRREHAARLGVVHRGRLVMRPAHRRRAVGLVEPGRRRQWCWLGATVRGGRRHRVVAGAVACRAGRWIDIIEKARGEIRSTQVRRGFRCVIAGPHGDCLLCKAKTTGSSDANSRIHWRFPGPR